jgi:hypothetical protein
MNQSAFAVTRFENRNGVISWRVDGRLHGVRIRKNFKTREEAIAEKGTLELKAMQADTGMRSVGTFLTEEQLREAETAFNRIKSHARPLTFYLDYALSNYREPQTRKKLLRAVAEYLAAKKHERQQDKISESHLVFMRRDLKRFLRHFPRVTVAELTAERLIEYFNFGKLKKPSLKTYNNRRGIVSNFLKFAFHRGWIHENPIAKVPHHRIRRKRGAAVTFSAAQAEALMHHVEGIEGGRFVPFFALCLFAGIRPSAALTRAQGYGNATICISPPSCPHRHHRPPHLRDFSQGTGAIDSHPPRMDQAPPHPLPPRRSLHLFRPDRGRSAHPNQAQGAASWLKKRLSAGTVKCDTQVVLRWSGNSAIQIFYGDLIRRNWPLTHNSPTHRIEARRSLRLTPS